MAVNLTGLSTMTIRGRVTRIFAIVIFLALCSKAWAGGKKEDDKTEALNNNWILCITDFDVSSLPENRRTIPIVAMRTLTGTLQKINYRVRISPEYAYYEDYALSAARTAAAKALASRYEERSLLLYQGAPEWKYRRNIKSKESDIAKAHENYQTKQAEMPLINQEPVFDITEGNKEGSFPAPPKKGAESRFCRDNNADAFLAGEIIVFHDRYFLTLKLYAQYTRSVIYEDDIIFSADDIDGAIDEIAGRLTAVLAGSKPAAIAIHAEPPETLVLINQSFAGRGSVEARDHPQGKMTVAFSLEDHKPESIEVELHEGELTVVSASLSRQPYNNMEISAPASRVGVGVYQGALYVGDAPLTLRLPLNQLNYVELAAENGEAAKAVFPSPDFPDESRSLSLKLKIPPSIGQKRVNKARGKYYWAWGTTWISAITWWIASGMFDARSLAVPYSNSDAFYNGTVTMQYVKWGGIALVATAAAYDLYQLARYIYTSTEDTTPIVKTEAAQ
jgi:hypothetical protein